MELVPSSFGIVLAAIALWKALEAEKKVDEMAERPRERGVREPAHGRRGGHGGEEPPEVAQP